MRSPASQRGFAALLAALIVVGAAGTLVLARLSIAGSLAERFRASDRALAQAREALVAYAAERPIDARVGPGYLPCPDLDDDGWAEPICGSLDGATGAAQRLGRLPWKTLGLADLRDGFGERLWYAVSSKHKGLLNCAASLACLDMTPDRALGAITVRDATGLAVHDGTSADLDRLERSGAAAVVVAPGPALARLDAGGVPGPLQARGCGPSECDSLGRCVIDPPQRAAKCDPASYLDRAPPALGGEDNAGFVDRSDPAGRPMNTDGFIQGPIHLPGAGVAVNDRLAVVAYADLMPRVMKRVAIEVSHCLAAYAASPGNGKRYPWPTAACRQAIPGSTLAWADTAGVRFGRVPDTPFTATRAASGDRMAERWPDSAPACAIAEAGGATAGLSTKSWWSAWKPFVFYALSDEYRPSASQAPPSCSKGPACLEVASDDGAILARGARFAVLVGGSPLERPGFAQRHDAAALGDARHWLEEPNASLEGSNPVAAAPDCGSGEPAGCSSSHPCNRVASGPRGRFFNDVVVARH